MTAFMGYKAMQVKIQYESASILPAEDSTNIVYIYTLVDPRYNSIRYVGKTKHPKERLNSHIRDGVVKKYYKGA
jgi:hypothetical protein